MTFVRITFLTHVLKTSLVFFGSLVSIGLGDQAFDEIPFELGKDQRVYLKCSVNGSQPLRFLLDTGATDMVMNPLGKGKSVAMKFDGQVVNNGATSSETINVSNNNKFTLGKQSFEKVPFLSIAYPPDLWDGVIGLWFLKKQVTEINYTKRKVFLYKNGEYTPPAGAIRLKVTYVMGVPCVPVTVSVNGKQFENLSLEVDTGSDRVLDLNTPFVEKHKLMGSQAPFAISRISGTSDQTGVLENIILDSVKMGDLVLPRIPGAFSNVKQGVQSSKEMDGVMGNSFLKRFNLVCDFHAGYIYLIPNDLLYTPFYDFLVTEPAQ